MAAKLNLRPEECLMVGNDVDEDILAASSIGMQVFLLDDCLINKHGVDISPYHHGDFDGLIQYIRDMI